MSNKSKTKDKITFLELFKSIRLPVNKQRAKVFKSKKSYNRKDKSWKNESINFIDTN